MRTVGKKMAVCVMCMTLFISSCGAMGKVASPDKSYSEVYEINLTREMKEPIVEFTKIANAIGLSMSSEMGNSVLLSKPGNPSLKGVAYGKSEWPFITLNSKSATLLQVTVKLTGNWGYAKKENADKLIEQIRNELAMNGYL